MHSPTLDQSSRLVSSTSWASIARGVFVTLAIQTVLLLFGLAMANSVGDRTPEGLYSVWVVLVFLVSFAIGGVIAAVGPRAEGRAGGFAAGFMVWAVAIVVGNVVSNFLVGDFRGRELSPLWTPLIASLLALGAALVGGALGAGLRGGSRRPPALDEDHHLEPTPYVGPMP
jgi:hypothetical protein